MTALVAVMRHGPTPWVYRIAHGEDDPRAEGSILRALERSPMKTEEATAMLANPERPTLWKLQQYSALEYEQVAEAARNIHAGWIYMHISSDWWVVDMLPGGTHAPHSLLEFLISKDPRARERLDEALEGMRSVVRAVCL